MVEGPPETAEAEPTGETPALFRFGFDLHRQGKLLDAGRIYQEVIRRDPRNVDALHHLGLLLYQSGHFERAADLIAQAIAVDPAVAAMHSNRGMALAALGRLAEAVEAYDAAIQLDPGFAGAHCNRGNALRALGRVEDAVENYDRAIGLQPAYAPAHRSRGAALRTLRRPDEALASFDRAIALAPGRADDHGDRGNVLEDLDRLDEAEASYAQAISLSPDNAAAHFNRGNALKKLGRIGEAIASYEQSIALRRDFAIARHNYAVSLLLDGRLGSGFLEYEWRKKAPDFEANRSYPGPALSGGEDIAGKTVFIYPELFLGDVIQFCRYARVAEARGAKVILAAPESLHGLLRTLSPSIEIAPKDAEPPAFDYHCALMSLPLAFQTTLRTIPNEVPYLRADAGRVESWKRKLGGHGVKIGICWQGSTLPYAVPMRRAFPLRELAGIGRLPDVRLISLQKHDGLDQLAALPGDMTVETLGAAFDAGPDAFLDTAAVMACCDLVITADTAVAHLAGALGVPTWIALPYVPDWRWMLDRDDSPWYPTARLFRQRSRGDWSGVFSGIEAALIAEMDSGRL